MTVWVVLNYDGVIGIYSSLELAHEARRRTIEFTFYPQEYDIDKLPKDRFSQTVVGQGI